MFQNIVERDEEKRKNGFTANSDTDWLSTRDKRKIKPNPTKCTKRLIQPKSQFCLRRIDPHLIEQLHKSTQQHTLSHFFSPLSKITDTPRNIDDDKENSVCESSTTPKNILPYYTNHSLRTDIPPQCDCNAKQTEKDNEVDMNQHEVGRDAEILRVFYEETSQPHQTKTLPPEREQTKTDEQISAYKQDRTFPPDSLSMSDTSSLTSTLGGASDVDEFLNELTTSAVNTSLTDTRFAEQHTRGLTSSEFNHSCSLREVFIDTAIIEGDEAPDVESYHDESEMSLCTEALEENWNDICYNVGL